MNKLIRCAFTIILVNGLMMSSVAFGREKLEIIGNTLVSSNDLLAQIGGEKNAVAIRSRVLNAYHEKGFLFVSVSVSVESNIIRVRVAQTSIKTISVHGAVQEINDLLQLHFAPLLNRVDVTQKELEIATVKSSDYSGISSQVELDEDHEGNFILNVYPRYIKSFGSASVENTPRNASLWSTLISQQYNSLFRAGDFFRVSGFLGHQFSGSSSAVQGIIHYRMPLSVSGLYLEAVAGSLRSGRLYDGSISTNESLGRGQQALILMGYPIMRDAHSFTYVMQELEYKNGRSKASGYEDDGSVAASRTHLIASYVDENGNSLKAGMSLTVGRSNHSSQPSYGEVFDKMFWHSRFGIGITTNADFILNGAAYKFELVGQYTNSKINPLELFILADKNRMRGYAISEGAGNKGFVNTHEFSVYKALNGEAIKSVSPFVFLDVGHAELKYQGSQHAKTMISAGAGFSLLLANKFGVDGWIGIPLKDGWGTKKHNPAFFARLTKAW